MKKILLAGFVASLPCAAMAQTAVQVYGTIDMYAGRTATATAPTNVNAINSGGMVTSYYGFSGTEELGGGTKAQFTIEGFFRADTGEAGRFPGEAMFARNANVGLSSGNLGLLRVGRIGNPLFVALGQINPFGPSTRLSPVVNQMFTAAGGNATLGDTGWSNAVNFTSQPVGDTVFVAQYALGEQPGAHNNNWAGVAKYTGKELAVTVGAQNVRFGNGVTTVQPAQRTYMAAASYDLQAVKLYATYGYHDAEISDRNSRIKQAGFTVPCAQGMGRWMVSWSRMDESAKGKADFHRDTGAVGYDHNLSPRTDIYSVFVYDKISNAGKGNTLVAGIRHRY